MVRRTIAIRDGRTATETLRHGDADESGTLTALFYGRTKIPGLICGSKVRLQGAAGSKAGRRVMINPLYELVSPED